MEDRAHRIGQTKTVHVYMLFCPGTAGEFMLDCLNERLRKMGRGEWLVAACVWIRHRVCSLTHSSWVNAKTSCAPGRRARVRQT